ncbi:hypothetical protein GEMRC1_010184 [Eukaryota sp. GEM-RC1]
MELVKVLVACACLVGFTAIGFSSLHPPAPLDSPLTNFLDAHSLEELGFQREVSYPIDNYVHTPIDDALSSITENGLYVLSGPDEIGKTVSLYHHLRKDHVIWLNSINGLCNGLKVLGFEHDYKTEGGLFVDNIRIPEYEEIRFGY